MHNSSGFRLLVSSFAVAGLLIVFTIAGCDEDTGPGPAKDTSVDVGVPDLKKGPDKSVDQTVWPPDIPGKEGGGIPDGPHLEAGYASSPFGCANDSDCFGQKCCPTPWGVKLCAPSCDTQP